MATADNPFDFAVMRIFYGPDMKATQLECVHVNGDAGDCRRKAEEFALKEADDDAEFAIVQFMDSVKMEPRPVWRKR